MIKAMFREICPNDGRSIFRNVVSLNILLHDKIDLLYNEQ